MVGNLDICQNNTERLYIPIYSSVLKKLKIASSIEKINKYEYNMQFLSFIIRMTYFLI